VCLVSASQFRDALQRKALTRRLAEEGSSRLAQYAIRLPITSYCSVVLSVKVLLSCLASLEWPTIIARRLRGCCQTAMSTRDEVIATRAEFKFMSRQGSTETVNRPAQ
jgi:hypothetical protein